MGEKIERSDATARIKAKRLPAAKRSTLDRSKADSRTKATKRSTIGRLQWALPGPDQSVPSTSPTPLAAETLDSRDVKKGEAVSSLPWHRVEARPADSAETAPAPPAHQAWGPEFWPTEVRSNVEEWPPKFRDRELIATIRTPLQGSHRITILSRKGGVGKTTLAHALRAIFDTYRTDRSVVVDASRPDQHGPGKLVEAAHGEPDVAGVVQRVGRGDRVLVAPAPGDTDVAALIELLSSPYQLIITDAAADIGEEALLGILDQTDQLIIIATPAVDELFAATGCLDDIREAGYGYLVDTAIVAINRIRSMPFSDLLQMDRHFAKRGHRVIRIPYDARVGDDQDPGLDSVRPSTRTGLFELAAAVAGRFIEYTSILREEEQK